MVNVDQPDCGQLAFNVRTERRAINLAKTPNANNDRNDQVVRTHSNKLV